MPTREQELEQENYQLKLKIGGLEATAAKQSQTFWLELVKMLLQFLTPVVTAGAVWLSYSATNHQIQESREAQTRISEQVEEVKTAAANAAEKVAEVKQAVESTREDLKGMN